MEIKTVHLVYYSATGNTQTVARAIGEALAQGLNAALREVDFTLPAARQAVQSFGPGDLVVAATPVYAGRVPNKMLPYVQEKLVGGGALAVPVVTFGNRSYDNGLKELQVELEGHGFRVVAGAGVPTEHVFSAKLAPAAPTGTTWPGWQPLAGRWPGRWRPSPRPRRSRWRCGANSRPPITPLRAPTASLRCS